MLLELNVFLYFICFITNYEQLSFNKKKNVNSVYGNTQ